MSNADVLRFLMRERLNGRVVGALDMNPEDLSELEMGLEASTVAYVADDLRLPVGDARMRFMGVTIYPSGSTPRGEIRVR